LNVFTGSVVIRPSVARHHVLSKEQRFSTNSGNLNATVNHHLSRLAFLSVFTFLSALSPVVASAARSPRSPKASATVLAASATANSTSGSVPFVVQFAATVKGGTAPYSYNWTFGDGGTSTSQNPSYTYTSVGTYAAALTVRDAVNNTATTSLTVNASTAAVSVSVTPATITVASAGTQQFVATVSGATNTAVTWSATAGNVSSTGLFTAPMVASSTKITVTATSQADPTKSASSSVAIGTVSASSGGRPQFGTPSSPMNLPISYWNVGVDSAATADLQSALSVSSYSKMYWTIGDDSFATYYSTSSDPVYTLADTAGNAKSCTGGGGTTYTTVHIPSSVTSSWNGLYNTTNDQHFAVVDLTNNQIFAFYSYGGDHLGISNGKWESDYRACDYMSNPNGDTPVANAVILRSSCSGFPCSNITGEGAGVAIGGTSASDRNAFMSPYGDIMPQDFDDTGWSGDAVGTLHHALYTIIPSGYIAGAVWPTPNEGGTNRSLKNGQIIQLDPYACNQSQFDVSCFATSDQRIAKTLMVYGAVISDFGSYGPKFSGQFSGKDQSGTQHYANPWTPEGTPGLSQAAYDEINSVTNNGTANVIYNTSISAMRGKLRAIMPHGPTY